MDIVSLLELCRDGMTKTRLAKRIGISYMALMYLYSGKRHMGRIVANALLREFPEHRSDILQVFLPENGNLSLSDLTIMVIPFQSNQET